MIAPLYVRWIIVATVILLLSLAGLLWMLRRGRRAQVLRERVVEVTGRQSRMEPAAGAAPPQVGPALAQAATPQAATQSRAWAVHALRVLTRSTQRTRDDLRTLWVSLAAGLLLALAIAQFMTRFFGPYAFCLVALMPPLVSRGVFARRDRRLQEAYRRQFPEVLAVVTRTVRVGVPVAEALRIVARESSQPTATAFSQLVNRLSIGIPLGDALHMTASSTGLMEHALFASAVALQAQTGGGLAETLTTLADTIRKRISAQDRAHALASEARTSALILGGLPVVAGALLALINPSYISVLITDPTGNTILGLACGSLTMGVFAMRFTIRKALS